MILFLPFFICIPGAPKIDVTWVSFDLPEALIYAKVVDRKW